MRLRTHILSWILFAMLVPVIYFGSFLPLSWACNRKYLGTPGSTSARLLEIYVVPLGYSTKVGPGWYVRAIVNYAEFLNKL
jgi:hypothetical protein